MKMDKKYKLTFIALLVFSITIGAFLTQKNQVNAATLNGVTFNIDVANQNSCSTS